MNATIKRSTNGWLDGNRGRTLFISALSVVLTAPYALSTGSEVGAAACPECDDPVAANSQTAAGSIAAEDLEMIFDCFSQDKPSPHEPIGTGLGLAIGREITQRNKGRVWAEPRDGDGSTSIVGVPRSESGQTAESNEEMT